MRARYSSVKQSAFGPSGKHTGQYVRSFLPTGDTMSELANTYIFTSVPSCSCRSHSCRVCTDAAHWSWKRWMQSPAEKQLCSRTSR